MRGGDGRRCQVLGLEQRWAAGCEEHESEEQPGGGADGLRWAASSNRIGCIRLNAASAAKCKISDMGLVCAN